MMRNATPGSVDDEIMIMALVGTTTAGEDEGPFAGLHSFKDGTLASAAGTAAMTSM